MGWYDGLNRLFSNRGRVLVNGKSYPIVGTVCMDQTMINLGPDTDVKVGDEVVLLGRSGDLEINLSDFAGMLNSIPYETVSRVSLRVDVCMMMKPTWIDSNRTIRNRTEPMPVAAQAGSGKHRGPRLHGPGKSICDTAAPLSYAG